MRNKLNDERFDARFKCVCHEMDYMPYTCDRCDSVGTLITLKTKLYKKRFNGDQEFFYNIQLNFCSQLCCDLWVLSNV